MSVILALGLYLAVDLVLSGAVLYLAYKRLPWVRTRLRNFLGVQDPYITSDVLKEAIRGYFRDAHERRGGYF